MKNRLHCEVTSCQHYSNSQCCLEGIQVDGPAARQPDQTCCASYQERRPGAGSNAMGQSPAGRATSAVRPSTAPITTAAAAGLPACRWAAAAAT